MEKSNPDVPQEVHHNILLSLPYSAVMAYCGSSTAYREICYSNSSTTQVFWKNKSLLDFGVDLDLLPTVESVKPTNIKAYDLLHSYLMSKDPQLIVLAIKSGNYEKALRLLKDYPKSHNKIGDVLMEARKHSHKLFFEVLTSLINKFLICKESGAKLVGILTDVYIDAINNDDVEALRILDDPVHGVPLDKHPYLHRLYKYAMTSGNVKLLDYIRTHTDIVDSDDIDEVEYALIHADSQEIFDYINSVYPGQLRTADVINSVLFMSIRYNWDEIVRKLFKWFPDLIDYDQARRISSKFNFPLDEVLGTDQSSLK